MTSPLHPLKMQSAAVRLANVLGAPLRGAISFQPEYLLDKARTFCNLTDFGGGDFEEPFRILTRSLDQGIRLHFTGRVLAQRELLRCLANRLRIAEYCRRNPGTENVVVPDPIVITGLPRSGTTFLHRILAQDSRTRTLRAWELFAPVPPGWGDRDAPDPRLSNLRQSMEWRRRLLWSSSGLSIGRSIHHLEADDPEECWPLLQNSFRCRIFGLHGVGEEYTLWLHKQDLTDAYRYYRRQLQILTASEPAGRLVVKYPGHLGCLDELFRVFPNARILWLHRDPVDVVPSACSLGMLARSLRTNATNPEKLGPRVMDGLLLLVRKGMEARQRHRPEHFLDVDYRNLIGNPIGTTQRIYEFLDWQTDREWEDSLTCYLARDRESRKGLRHQYGAEAFGLNAGAIRAAFRSYTERFLPVAESARRA